MVLVVDDGSSLSVGPWVVDLLQFAAHLGESVSFLISSDPAVGWNPLQCDGGLPHEFQESLLDGIQLLLIPGALKFCNRDLQSVKKTVRWLTL